MKFTVFKPTHSHRKTELFALLNLNPYKEEEKRKLDSDAIIKEVQHNPKSAKIKYQFPQCSDYYPLQMAVRLGANTDVLEALYKAYPPAIQAENLYGDTMLHLALRYRTLPDVILFLLDRWPESAQKRDRSECTPLHVACCFNAPWKVVSQLVDVWPAALRRTTGTTGFTPLSYACMYKASLDVVSYLLDRYPDAVKEKTSTGCTPLHLACHRRDAPLDIILKLLDKWPEAIRERNEHYKTPLDNIEDTEAPDKVRKLLWYVSELLDNNTNDEDFDEITAEKAMSFFTTLKWHTKGDSIVSLYSDCNHDKRIAWQKGVALVLDKKPSMTESCDILNKVSLNELPDFLSMVGHQCHVTTMWDILRNKQDVLNGV